MLQQKFVYTALAVILIAGLAGAFVLYRMLVSGNVSDFEITRVVNKKIAGSAETQKPSLDNPALDEENKEEGKADSFISNLLKNPTNRPLFGSFRLKSIIAADSNPESSRATIEDIDTGSSRTYSIQDTLPDSSQLVDIKQDYVILEKNGVRKRIFFTYGSDNRGGLYPPGPEGHEKIGDNEFNLHPYRVFRGDANSVLDFSMKIHSREGDMEGIQVSGIQRDTLADVLGLKDGDVLLEVNGQRIDSVLNTVRASMNAHRSDDLLLNVRRNGRIVTLKYHLFWEGQGSWTSIDVLNSKAVSSLFDDSILSNLF